MNIQIPANEIIKEQTLEVGNGVSIIYGCNNSGKTTILRVINDVFNAELMESIFRGTESPMPVYIPTNRIIAADINTESTGYRDREDFLNYQRAIYRDYSLHIKKIRDYLLKSGTIFDFLRQRIKNIFDLDIQDLEERHSDGIDNIINIYLSIIWVMLWNQDLSSLTEGEFHRRISRTQLYVMIDEIEMFLHVKIQAKLISSLKEDFKACGFLLTTHSPVMLTRYRDCRVYNIEDGLLTPIDAELYYEDLDNVYETLFFVDELPLAVREDINYLGKVILREAAWDKPRIWSIAEKLKQGYPNVFRKYNKIITKAQYAGEKHDGAQTKARSQNAD